MSAEVSSQYKRIQYTSLREWSMKRAFYSLTIFFSHVSTEKIVAEIFRRKSNFSLMEASSSFWRGCMVSDLV